MDRSEYNVVFMGTPEFARGVLEAVYNAGFNVNLVVTNPDTPSGRGMKLKMSKVKEYALEKGLEVYQPEKLRNNEEALDIIKGFSPDFIVTAAYGKILPQSILDIPKIAPVNVHGSILPKYRGSAPVQWAIINGEKVTGITTMIMDAGMDTGDMLLKEETEITEEDNLMAVFDRLEKIGSKLIVETLDGLISGKIDRVKQDEALATIAPMITKEMTKIDFNKSPREVFNFVRGMYAAYMEDDEGNKIKVFKVRINEMKETSEVGKVVEVTKKSLTISVNGGTIDILELQAPNSKKMDIISYLAGNKIEVGKKFV
ncbi:MAG: methionyl-tRNA formyltransferase [Clostridia bacterium]|nr:methionyl-tRNA formyltransferase [Clostridia bacterium]